MNPWLMEPVIFKGYDFEALTQRAFDAISDVQKREDGTLGITMDHDVVWDTKANPRLVNTIQDIARLQLVARSAVYVAAERKLLGDSPEEIGFTVDTRKLEVEASRITNPHPWYWNEDAKYPIGPISLQGALSQGKEELLEKAEFRRSKKPVFYSLAAISATATACQLATHTPAPIVTELPSNPTETIALPTNTIQILPTKTLQPTPTEAPTQTPTPEVKQFPICDVDHWKDCEIEPKDINSFAEWTRQQILSAGLVIPQPDLKKVIVREGGGNDRAFTYSKSGGGAISESDRPFFTGYSFGWTEGDAIIPDGTVLPSKWGVTTVAFSVPGNPDDVVVVTALTYYDPNVSEKEFVNKLNELKDMKLFLMAVVNSQHNIQPFTYMNETGFPDLEDRITEFENSLDPRNLDGMVFHIYSLH